MFMFKWFFICRSSRGRLSSLLSRTAHSKNQLWASWLAPNVTVIKTMLKLPRKIKGFTSFHSGFHMITNDRRRSQRELFPYNRRRSQTIAEPTVAIHFRSAEMSIVLVVTLYMIPYNVPLYRHIIPRNYVQCQPCLKQMSVAINERAGFVA